MNEEYERASRLARLAELDRAADEASRAASDYRAMLTELGDL